MDANIVFGYFDEPGQTAPTFDPGPDAPCPICLKKLEPPVMTISLMAPGSARSYFYRIHKGCADENAQHDLESALIDSLPVGPEESGNG
jgi:hypothetical protein